MNQRQDDLVRRRAEFEALFIACEKTNKYRAKRICEILYCQPQSVRIWRCKTSDRTCTDANLKIIRRALGDVKQ